MHATPMFEVLVTAGLPREDATRLAEVFKTYGVADSAYMRVFARMSSRDTWLEELRQTGVLTVIQMRVVREILERAAFAPVGDDYPWRLV